MIPKIIHYCWFGGNEKPEIIKKCIESWKKFCPDYEIIEWNESNFDVNCNQYVKDAYAAKKWAFVSDYARLKVVYDNGGIYLDTDVLLHASLNELLKFNCWLASDDVRYINTGLGFGAIKYHSLIKAIMEEYLTYEFSFATCVLLNTKVIERELHNWVKSDKSQLVSDVYIVGIKDYGKYAKHIYTYTWRDTPTDINTTNKKSNKFKWKIKCLVRNPKYINFFDKKKGSKFERIYTFIAYDFLDYGFLHYVKLIYKKLQKKISNLQ